jgi:hypothetical protein
MGAITIDNIFQSVILATLKSSNNRTLRTAYDQFLDDPLTSNPSARADPKLLVTGTTTSVTWCPKQKMTQRQSITSSSR